MGRCSRSTRAAVPRSALHLTTAPVQACNRNTISCVPLYDVLGGEHLYLSILYMPRCGGAGHSAVCEPSGVGQNRLLD